MLIRRSQVELLELKADPEIPGDLATPADPEIPATPADLATPDSLESR
jgi:hypothetical protein